MESSNCLSRYPALDTKLQTSPVTQMSEFSSTHYQTSFVVSKEGGSPFHDMQVLMLDWLIHRRDGEKDKVLVDRRMDFFRECDFRNLYETRSNVCTNTFFKRAGGNAWALRYTRLDSVLGKRRYWYTDVTLLEREQDVVMFVRVSFARNRDDLSTEIEVPKTNVPRFVRDIVTGPYKVFSGRSEFRLSDKPIHLNRVGQGMGLSNLITSPDRKYPLVVFNGDSEDLVKEADSLARDLAGKCQVLVIAENQDLAAEVSAYLHRDLYIRHGKFRVFFALDPRYPNPRRHRWFDPASEDYALQREGVVNGLLRTHPLVEDDAVESINEIGRLIRRHRFTEFLAEHEEKSEELKAFYSVLEETETERDQVKESLKAVEQDSALYAEMYDEMERELAKLKGQLERDRSQKAADTAISQRAGFVSTFRKLPTSLEEIVKAFSEMYPDRLIFLEAAYKSARDYSKFDCINDAWELLHDLANVLWAMKFDGVQVFCEANFNVQSRFELAMSEGRNTKRDASLMAARRVQHERVAYDITPHLKWGNKEPKALRVYFAFDEGNRRIVVGHVGAHLANSTSKSIK